MYFKIINGILTSQLWSSPVFVGFVIRRYDEAQNSLPNRNRTAEYSNKLNLI